MKVALIHFRILHAGGLENRIRNYASWLIREGHSVDIICNQYDPGFPLPEGANVIRLKKLSLPKVFRMWAFDRALGGWMENNKYDFSLGMGRTSHHEAVLAPGNHLGYLRALGKKPFGLSDWMQIRMDKKGHDHSRIIFAASGMMKKELEELYSVPAEKVHILYPPLDETRFSLIPGDQRTRARKAIGIPADEKVFLFVSGSHSRKGLPLLLKVFRELEGKGVRLLIAGNPTSALLPSNVHPLGFREDIREVYALADFLVHPAMYEPYGQIVAEAVSCGVPAMVSDRTAAHEILDAKTGIVLPWNDVQAWKTAVISAAANSFSIPNDWALKRGITLDQHMRKMLLLAGKIS